MTKNKVLRIKRRENLDELIYFNNQKPVGGRRLKKTKKEKMEKRQMKTYLENKQVN